MKTIYKARIIGIEIKLLKEIVDRGGDIIEKHQYLIKHIISDQDYFIKITFLATDY